MLYLWHFAACKWYNKWYADLHQLLDSRAHSFWKWVWSRKCSVSPIRVLTFKCDYPLGPEIQFLCGRRVSYAVTRVWLLFLPCPPLLQTRGRSPTPHAWWHCPPALLPLASGDICGGRAHCGPDHLCQEPGGQGRSHEEAQVLLTGRRIVGSQAQRLSHQVSTRLPCRAHIWWHRRWKGLQQASARPLLQWWQKQAQLEESGTYHLYPPCCSSG